MKKELTNLIEQFLTYIHDTNVKNTQWAIDQRERTGENWNAILKESNLLEFYE